MKPIIGIIICGTSDNKQFVTQPYIETIIRSGGIPIILPNPLLQINSQSFYKLQHSYIAYHNLCHGFLFCGGDDVSPFLFNEPPLCNLGKTNTTLDLFQISFMEYLLKHHKPILCICRGMQIINVALGGTLYQDLSLRNRPTFSHMQNSTSRKDISHRVNFYQNNIFHDIFGDFEFTNSFHHQAIHKLGNELTVCGESEDGVIEAVQMQNHPFALGVQWHPECMYEISKKSQKLFHIFLRHSSNTTPVKP